MIKTTFRIELVTDATHAEMFDNFALMRVFKCAPAKLIVDELGGLPAAREEIVPADAGDEAASEASELAAGLKTAGELLAQVVSATGRKITPEAINIYRETQAMRRSFGIRKDERKNIDPSFKLPRIMAEPFQKFDPEKLVPATALPKTQRDRVAEALKLFPRELPTLALRVSLLHRPFWEADDPVARQNWKKVVLPQTLAMVNALQNDLLRLEVPSNLPEEMVEHLRFGRLELHFERYVLSIANEDVNRFGDVEGALTSFYDALNSGALDAEDLVRADLPFMDYAAIEAHILDEMAAREAAEAEAAAAAEAAALEEAAAAEAASDDVAADPTASAAGNPVGDAMLVPRETLYRAPETVDDSLENSATLAADDAASETETAPDSAIDPEADPAAEGEAEPAPELPPSRTHGIAAVRLAEQTIADAHANIAGYALGKAERARAEAEAIERLAEKGIEIPVSEYANTWGIITRESELRYFNIARGEFCDRPEEDDRVDVVELASQIEAEQAAAAPDTTLFPAPDGASSPSLAGALDQAPQASDDFEEGDASPAPAELPATA